MVSPVGFYTLYFHFWVFKLYSNFFLFLVIFKLLCVHHCEHKVIFYFNQTLLLTKKKKKKKRDKKCLRSNPFNKLYSFWKPKVPTKVAVFLWTATLGKFLTIDNLRRSLLVIDWYWICKSTGETINHLRLNCPVKNFWVLYLFCLGFCGLCQRVWRSF